MSSAARHFLKTLRSAIFPLIGLLVLMLPTLRAVDEVDVDSTVAVAYRQGTINGQFSIVRSGSASPVTVDFHLAGTAVLGTDYNIQIDGGPTIMSGSAFVSTMAAGQQESIITVIPLTSPPGPPGGHVDVDLVIDPSGSAYSIGGGSQSTVIIADNSMTATLTVPHSLASDDPALLGLSYDPQANRRGVVKVGLTPSPLVAYRNVEVSVGGTASLGTKYNLFWKVGGSDVGQGQGYKLTYYYDVASSVIGVISNGATANEGDTITFTIGLTNYTGTFTAASTSLLTGSTAIFNISPALTAPLVVGTTILGRDTTLGTSVSYTVDEQQGYLAGATTFSVAGGGGIFSQGDLVSFPSTPGLYFIVKNIPSPQLINGETVWTLVISGHGGVKDPSATLDFASNGGIPDPIPLETPMLGEFPITTTTSEVLIPPTSSQVEFSIEPTLNNAPTGAETATLTLSQSYDYNMTTPTVGTVTIADAVVQANISLGANASQPSTAGAFLITLTHAFPTPVTVPYTIFDDGNAAIQGTDYFGLLGTLTIPAGQTSATLSVTPISTDAILPPGGKDVGVILSGSLDYKLAGSGTTLTNPSATLNIAPSLGAVGITGSPTVAFMNPSAPGNTTFTVSIARSTGTTQAVIVNYTVGGSAQQGVDYTPLTLSTPTGYASTGSVTIPAGQNSANITIAPIEDQTSSGILQVVLTLTGGQGYTINSTNVSAAVSIQSDTPTLRVVAGTDAIQPSTAGSFVISYPGVPAGTVLNHPLTVSYALSGTAKVGTDYANPGTITIPAGTNTVTVQITPSNNPLTTDQSVILTLTPASTYAIAPNQGTATIALHFVTPPPVSTATTSGSTGATGGGQASYSSSGGGCGVGGGMGLLVVALALSRRRR